MKSLLISIIISFICMGLFAQNGTEADNLFKHAVSCAESGDYVTAFSYYQKAAEHNHSQAENELGIYYLSGLGGAEQSYENAKYWFQKSADQNNGYAQYNIGYMFFNAMGVDKDYNKAFAWFQKSAEQNNIMGLYGLGVCYKEGYGTVKDYGKSMSSFKKTAEYKIDDISNNLEHETLKSYITLSENEIGFFYEKGVGSPQNWDSAHYWYMKAAEAGFAQAQTNIGCIYYNGSGNYTKDYHTAYSWFIKAAEQGNAQAQRLLGYLYMNGWGCPQDHDKAYFWTSKAVGQDDAQAQNNLGFLYMNGWGVEKDYQKAMSWFQKAEKQNEAKAQYNIGYLYENGLGVPKDLNEALTWYLKAYENGYKLARSNLAVLQNQLKSDNNSNINIPIVKDRCIALIIGNADYKNASLKNPINDAEDMTKKFKLQGIETISCYNGTKDNIRNCVIDFCEKTKQYDAAIFYYSGHGLQKDGINYIVPVNAEISEEKLIQEECISMNDILQKIDQSGVKKKILILDACRTYNAGTTGGKGLFAKGLANMQQITGIPLDTFILYATSAGNVSEDGIDSRNSPFTYSILKMLDTINIEITTLAVNVREEVVSQTNFRQIPSWNDNLVKKHFFFNVKK